MTGNLERGVWNGIRYEIHKSFLSSRRGCISIFVHKDFLNRPDEELETKKISFLDYEWTSCVTVHEDRSIEAVWRLCSPVEEKDSLRCCWMMSEPVLIPGPTIPLKHDGRYGGTCPTTNVEIIEEFIRISYRLRTCLSSEEELAVHEGSEDTCCVWRLKQQPNKTFLSAERFFSHGIEWGICLFTQPDSSNILELVNLLGRNLFQVEFEAFLIGHPVPKLALFKKMTNQKSNSVRFQFVLPQQTEPTETSSFIQKDGFLKLGLRLSLPKMPPALTNECYALNRSQVAIQVFNDEHIKRTVKNDASISVFDVPKSQIFLFPPHWSLNTVKTMIEKDARIDPSELTIWFCCEKTDGVSSKTEHIDVLGDLDFRLSELGERKNPQDPPVITFYLQPSGNHTLQTDIKSSVLLFCMLLTSQEKKLEYIGSIAVASNCNLYSLCFIHLCNLYEGLDGMECSFFYVDSAHCFKQIRSFQKKPEEIGLTSGNVLIVRPLMEDEAVNADQIQQELVELQPDRLPEPTVPDAPPPNDNHGQEDRMCIICEDKSQTSGFYHGETVHICACEACARKVYEKEPRRCPICRELCTGFVSKIF